MNIKEITWSDPDGDKYEGLEIAKVKGKLSLSSQGALYLLDDAEIELSVIAQTAYRPYNARHGAVPMTAKGIDEARARSLESLLQDHLIAKCRNKFEVMLSRLTDDLSTDFNCFKVFPATRYEVVGDFDYPAHLMNKSVIIRFFALYARSMSLLEDLEKEKLSNKDLLLDSRLYEISKFLGRKGPSMLEFVAKMEGPVLTNIKSLIEFYL